MLACAESAGRPGNNHFLFIHLFLFDSSIFISLSSPRAKRAGPKRAQKVKKSILRCEMDRLSEGYKWAVDKIWDHIDFWAEIRKYRIAPQKHRQEYMETAIPPHWT